MKLFSNTTELLRSQEQKTLESPDSWFNSFYREVVSKIDESIYAALYSERKGRPNAPVRILLSMIILKEGFGWTDIELDENVRFNLLVRRALGLNNLDDSVPAPSTYYDFKRKLLEYKQRSGVDLLERTFQQITVLYLKELQISGKKVRMDTKLISTNVARGTRLQMLVEAVKKYLNTLSEKELKLLSKAFEQQYGKLWEQLINKKKSSDNITYRLSSKQKEEMLLEVGRLIRDVLKQRQGDSGKYYELLRQMYEEHYEEVEPTDKTRIEKQDDSEAGPNPNTATQVESEKEQPEEGDVVPKESESIPTDSIQSIHDPEACFRRKGHGHRAQHVVGGHTLIGETCKESNPINLILSVITKSANVSENDMLEEALEACSNILNEAGVEEMEEFVTDGGFDSKEIRKEMLRRKDEIRWNFTNTKGEERVFIMKCTDIDGLKDLEVFDKKTGQKLEVRKSKSGKGYTIVYPCGKKAYKTVEQVKNYLILQELESRINKESLKLRSNVESTIHHCFHRLKKGSKILYRGLDKCHWYALARALWVNFSRVRAFKRGKGFVFSFFRPIVLLIFYMHLVFLRLAKTKNKFTLFGGNSLLREI